MRNLIRLVFALSLVVGKELLAPTQQGTQGGLQQRMATAGQWKSDVDKYLADSAAAEQGRVAKVAFDALPGQESEGRSSLAGEEQAAREVMREAMARDSRLVAMGTEEQNKARALVGLPPLPVKPAAAKVVQSEVAPVVTTPRGQQWATPGGVLPLIGSPRVSPAQQPAPVAKDSQVSAETTTELTQPSPRRAEAFFGGEGAQPEQPRVRPTIPPIDTAKSVRVARAEALAESSDLTNRMDRLAEAIRPPVPGIAISGVPTSSFPDVRPRAGRAAAGSDQQAATLPAPTRVEESVVLPLVRPGTAMRPGPAAPAAAQAPAIDPAEAGRLAAQKRAQAVLAKTRARAEELAAKDPKAGAQERKKAVASTAMLAATPQPGRPGARFVRPDQTGTVGQMAARREARGVFHQ